jgi:hypothetical protein
VLVLWWQHRAEVRSLTAANRPGGPRQFFLPVNKKLFAFKLKKIILYQRVRVSANIKNTAMSSLLRNIAPCCCGSLRIEETYDKATFEYHWICLDCNNTSEPSPIQNQAFLNWQMESIAWFYFFS